ncbi:hypothetical protein BU23DRAFT_597079 [Bimuria novae-zelandiae CBS 107.79]|uniref:Uncharacterized protein n=1 Tax=Bimuria novae-zelandiae CBS 107.79 TaxID=1447943 RepID=A0A6A5VIE8_9PLEO|nr:hypothetical protein BU23DRAFT_597079 [Bimuria novae-zelandiae CBS 107.79]
MKLTLALASLLALASAAPTAEHKRQPHGAVLPAFTHTWTDTPGLGYYTANTYGRVFFPQFAGEHPISTHQTFTPSTSLRGKKVRLGFHKGSAAITAGTRFRVHTSLSSLDLHAGVNKADTNNQRDNQVAVFEVSRTNGAVNLIEGGTFTVPDRTKFTLEIVGDNKVPPNADFEFNAGVGEGLYLVRV